MRLSPCLLLVLLLAVACGSWEQRREAADPKQPQRPNILFVLTDDQPASTVWAMPTVEAELRGGGVTFDNAFNSDPVCCPSRATILTGRYAHNHRVWLNEEPQGGEQGFRKRGLGRDTIATRLKEAGYATGYFGKYFNGYEERYVPRGWDRWLAFAGSKPGDSYEVNSDGEVRPVNREQWHPTYLIAQKAESFLSAQGEQPWFAYVAPQDPHAPYDPAPRHAHDFDGVKLPDKPSFDRVDPSQPSHVRDRAPLSDDEKGELRREYEDKLEGLQAADDLVAQLLGALKETGQLKNTYVFFATDNGYLLGEHRLTKKGKPYEEAVRTPLLVRGPGVPAGQTREQLVSNVDLAPTFAELAGAEPPEDPDGRSLAPLLSDDPPSSWREAVLLESRSGGDPTFSGVRTHRYAYFEYVETGEEELYDLGSDPYQLKSIHESADPALRAELRARLEALKNCAAEDCKAAEGVETVEGRGPPLIDTPRSSRSSAVGRRIPRSFRCRPGEVLGDAVTLEQRDRLMPSG